MHEDHWVRGHDVKSYFRSDGTPVHRYHRSAHLQGNPQSDISKAVGTAVVGGGLTASKVAAMGLAALKGFAVAGVIGLGVAAVGGALWALFSKPESERDRVLREIETCQEQLKRAKSGIIFGGIVTAVGLLGFYLSWPGLVNWPNLLFGGLYFLSAGGAHADVSRNLEGLSRRLAEL